MKMKSTAIGAFAILFLLVPVSTHAQGRGAGRGCDGRGCGPCAQVANAAAPQWRHYDPSTVKTVGGEVTAVERTDFGRGRCSSGGIHRALQLRDGNGVPKWSGWKRHQRKA
jgi:hypothetical protein